MTPSQAVHAILRGWEEGDPDAIAAVFAEDGIFDDPLQPQRRVGPAEIRAACAQGIAAIHHCRIPVRALVESGDIAFVEGEFRSKLAGRAIAEPPWRAINAATSSLSSREIEPIKTCAPCAARPTAMALPKPRLPLVTAATRPLRSG